MSNKEIFAAADKVIGYQTPTTWDELYSLDRKHEQAGLGDLWMKSIRREEILEDIKNRQTKEIALRLQQDSEIRIHTPQVLEKLPVAAIISNGDQRVIGSAEYEVDETGTGIIARIVIDGVYALDILKEGTPAFSIGYSDRGHDYEYVDVFVNEDPQIQNEVPKTKDPRWMRRQKSKTEKTPPWSFGKLFHNQR